MIVFDTNVVSELVRPRPSPVVLAWAAGIVEQDIAITAMTAAELLHGIARLPAGRRRTALAAATSSMIASDFDGLVLPFDALAAEHYAGLVRAREAAGLPIATADAVIAATCLAFDATLATRNTGDFVETGLALVDPWAAG